MRIWVTRAQPGAEQTAERLRALGHDPLVAPVLYVRRLAVDPPDLTGISAIVFTSANAVRSFAGLVPDGAPDSELARRLPVYAVGDATAAEARENGFATVVSADGDAAVLARAMLKRRDEIGGLVLHPCALEAAGDVAGVLARDGVQVRPLALYDTAGVEEIPATAAFALRSQALDLVMIHSPKAARVLRSLMPSPQPLASLAGKKLPALAALSAACAAPLTGLGFAAVVLASAPREDALLKEFAAIGAHP